MAAPDEAGFWDGFAEARLYASCHISLNVAERGGGGFLDDVPGVAGRPGSGC